MDLKDILKDKTGYPDALAIQLGTGVQVTLGQIRSLSAADQAEITRKEKELTDRAAAIAAEDDKVKKAQMNTAQLYTALIAAREAIANGKFDTLAPEIKALFGNQTSASGNGNNNNDPFAALSRLEQDTLMGPIVNVIKSVAAEAKAAQTAVAANVEVQKKMATNYMNGVLEDRYDRLVPTDKQDKITLESLIRDAVSHGEFSSDSVPNIRAAYKRATSADTQAAHDAAIAEAAIKKYQEEQAGKVGQGGDGNIFVGQPANFGIDVHNRSGVAPQPFKSLDEAFAAAAKDKSLWTAIDGTQN